MGFFILFCFVVAYHPPRTVLSKDTLPGIVVAETVVTKWLSL